MIYKSSKSNSSSLLKNGSRLGRYTVRGIVFMSASNTLGLEKKSKSFQKEDFFREKWQKYLKMAKKYTKNGKICDFYGKNPI